MEKEKLITLVQQAQQGDSDAHSQLFAAYRNEVYSIAMQQTKNRTLSEDIVQETFLEVILKIEDLKQPASFPSWLKVLAYHQCTRYYKKKESVHEVSAAENEEGFSVLDTLEETNAAFLPDAALDQAEFRATILGMLDTLPDAQRAALQMFYYEQMPLKVIAKVQGVSVNTANTRLNRGRLAVKNSVEEYEKKHGVRLHTIAFFPFFRWLLRGTKQAMPEDAAVRVAQGIAVKSGVNLSAKTGLAGSAATSTSAVPTASAADKTAAAGLKVIPAGLATKIVAGVAAVSIVAGGVAVVQSGVERKEKPETVAVMQETRETVGSPGAETEGRQETIEETTAAPADTIPARRAFQRTLQTIHDGMYLPECPDYGSIKLWEPGTIEDETFAICDVDGDGREELLVSISNTFTAGMCEIIYGYDASTDGVRIEARNYVSVTHYPGFLRVDASHDHGYAGGLVWPHTIMTYNERLDTYEKSYDVDAWRKDIADYHPTLQMPFPDEADADRDGCVYLILEERQTLILDRQEFEDWESKQYMQKQQISIPWQNMTAENIAQVVPSSDGGQISELS